MRLRIKTPDKIYEYICTSETITIGRSSENDFVIPLEDFSRKHCQLTIKGNYIFLMDLGSKNGIIINGKRIPEHQQYPVYKDSKIILANFFELNLFEDQEFSEDFKQDLDIETIPDKKIR